MNWDAIGAAGEIVGAAAVVASLAYLAAQIRAQSRESRLAAMHQISVGMREVMTRFGAQDMAPIVVKAYENAAKNPNAHMREVGMKLETAQTASDQNPAFRMELWGSQSNMPTYLVVGAVRVDIPFGGSRLVPDPLTSDVYIGPLTGNLGHAGIDLALPPGLSGITFWAQWLTFADDFQCTNYKVTLSEAMELEID